MQFYWLETLDAAIFQAAAPQLGLKWPKYHNKYALVWPNGLADFAHVTVPAGGSTTTTGVFFGGGGVPPDGGGRQGWFDFGEAPDAGESHL